MHTAYAQPIWTCYPHGSPMVTKCIAKFKNRKYKCCPQSVGTDLRTNNDYTPTFFKLFIPCTFSTYGMKINWCHYFIRILLDLYMFRAHRPIFRRVRTAVHTTVGSVSVPLCSRALCVVTCVVAKRAAQKLNQWLCEQLYELSWRWACGPETCRDPAIYE